jgi:hypothetical protein
MLIPWVRAGQRFKRGKEGILCGPVPGERCSISLDRIRREFEISVNNPLVEGQLTMKSVLLKQPKILSKVIPRFESKLGAGRLSLRWTTRRSQVQ